VWRICSIDARLWRFCVPVPATWSHFRELGFYGAGAIKQKGASLMGTARIPDHDRLDRMERKLNRIGKYVLFGIALFAVLLAVDMQRASTDLFFGYERLALWSFIGLTTIIFLVARAPFRD
jgi:hypothetical protein